MPEPQIIPPEEARALYNQVRDPVRPVEETIRNLAHTAAVLGEQREAVLAIHRPMYWRPENYPEQRCAGCSDHPVYPCPTASGLGVPA